ncbi:MAG: hypothetical protein HOP18_08345, partial [Deltaproteobacteria bacterium]|nr:hypothetical protein [Deltaproteobacteria bacterium]
VVSGFVFALVEMSYGMHRLMGVAFGGAIAIGVLTFMTAVGWTGAVV